MAWLDVFEIKIRAKRYVVELPLVALKGPYSKGRGAYHEL